MRSLRYLRSLMSFGHLLFAGLLVTACSSTAPRPSTPQNTAYVPGLRTDAGSGSSLTRWRTEDWQQLPGWSERQAQSAWQPFLQSCKALGKQRDWQQVCMDAQRMNAANASELQRFFEERFRPWHLTNDDGSTTGLITGYYEPVLRGSLTRHGPYQTPVYRYPHGIASTQVNKPRAHLMKQPFLKGRELVWVDDPVDVAYLQVQGSGRVRLEDGRMIRVGFAGTNNLPFRSFARWLLDRHQITADQATIKGIKQWAHAHPQQVDDMLNANPRVVFFREMPAVDESTGPTGALGVPLTPEHSIAVDPSHVPLGAPVFLSTTRPLSNEPIQKLVIAQDTGSAIKGTVRADYFWGLGDAAGETAGRMKQRGEMWVLLPRYMGSGQLYSARG
ncbi:murein transglycosylase A [Zymobacter palmae]|uniref:Membrane-bound lytic murein transglycosylase A n=1 Tax=Zymobacter palmae TaxID=33074 RepID=A0A348HB73_9GAMM|nr:MltA domain-containing protein [Zymobacter palmae]BBG28875.1 membrane-bound lytic murein transglycosylase [Zymobacter palmae]